MCLSESVQGLRTFLLPSARMTVSLAILAKCQKDFSIQVTVFRKLYKLIDKFLTCISAIASKVWDYFMNFQMKSCENNS